MPVLPTRGEWADLQSFDAGNASSKSNVDPSRIVRSFITFSAPCDNVNATCGRGPAAVAELGSSMDRAARRGRASARGIVRVPKRPRVRGAYLHSIRGKCLGDGTETRHHESDGGRA